MSAAGKSRLSRTQRLAALGCMGTLLLMLQGCAVLLPYNPPPQNVAAQVEIPGMPGVRAWGDVFSESLQQSGIESMEQEKAANQGKLPPVVYALALSGGGGDGAFGAGLLCGWTETGTRPIFKLVTGISTGALMAPFAFLGPAYDQRLKEAYTTISDEDIYKAHNPLALLLSLANLKDLQSMADTAPLAGLLERLMDDRLIKEVAAEHRKGRRLLVGTTQLDAQRLVIWNLGAVAASGHPDAPKLFRKILIASASVPAAFPPQYFAVEAGGQKFQEMHVDGGVKVEVMLYEDAIKPMGLAGSRPRRLYIIRNQQVYPQWEKVKPQLKYIATRAIDSFTKSQGVGDLFRLYTYAQRDGIDYNLAYIPPDFTANPKSEFDTAYMNQLFEFGRHLGCCGYPWSKYPPGFQVDGRVPKKPALPDAGKPGN